MFRQGRVSATRIRSRAMEASCIESQLPICVIGKLSACSQVKLASFTPGPLHMGRVPS